MFKLPHFDRSWAMTVMIDFGCHKHKRMITDPKVNVPFSVELVRHKSMSVLAMGMTHVGSVIN